MVESLSQEVIAVIPARGGSKGVPRKNLHSLKGQPLIAWTIQAAQAAKCIGRVIVSTDDAEIATVARDFGADVPFMRPPELAEDATPDLPVCLHVLHHLVMLERTLVPRFVVWLRPTAPLRSAADIEAAVGALAASDADSLRSVAPSKAHPYWTKTLEGGLLRAFIPGKDDNTHPRRQELPPVYMLNGAVDVVRGEFVMRQKSLWGERVAAYVMPPERSIDIDTLVDFEIAEIMLRHLASANAADGKM